MGENMVPSIDSGVSCSEEGPVGGGVDTSSTNICCTLFSQHRGERDLRAAKAGAFQEHQYIAYAVPFPTSASRTETGNAAPGAQRMEEGVNDHQHAGASGQSPTDTMAQFVRVESPVPLVLLFLMMLQRRIASLEAELQAISNRVRVPSPRIMSPGTSSAIGKDPESHAAEESQPSEYQPASNGGDRCQQSEALLGSNSVRNVNSRCGHRCHRQPDFRFRAPPEGDRVQEPPRISDPRGVEQEPPRSDSRFCQPDAANSLATYEPNRHEPRCRRQYGVHEGRFCYITATESPSFTWTPNNLVLTDGDAVAYGHAQEEFSPVSQISGYQVRLYARCANKDGCAVVSFSAQVCAGVKNSGVPRPFCGTLKFIIHHPTCSGKSRVYIVRASREKRAAPTSDVGMTLFRLTGLIPEMTLRREGFWAAGTPRVTIIVCA